MANEQQEQPPSDWLATYAQVEERPFTSSLPLIGGLVAWLRTRWHNVAARWYMSSLTQQQNRFNRQLVNELRRLDSLLIDQDRAQTKLLQETAALTATLKQMTHLLEAIEARLQQLEANQKQPPADPK